MFSGFCLCGVLWVFLFCFVYCFGVFLVCVNLLVFRSPFTLCKEAVEMLIFFYLSWQT